MKQILRKLLPLNVVSPEMAYILDQNQVNICRNYGQYLAKHPAM
ncbi:hypothetical protein [Oscillibacter sp.]|nr:hypothetical protein [Oscillibacter sp.]